MSTNHLSRDTDGDQMPDAWDVSYHLNPLVDDAWEDPDHDGHSNFGEYLSGSISQDLFDIPHFDVDLDADGIDLLDIILEMGATDCN